MKLHGSESQEPQCADTANRRRPPPDASPEAAAPAPRPPTGGREPRGRPGAASRRRSPPARAAAKPRRNRPRLRQSLRLRKHPKSLRIRLAPFFRLGAARTACPRCRRTRKSSGSTSPPAPPGRSPENPTRSPPWSGGSRRLRWNFAQRGETFDRADRHVATVLAGVRRTQGRPPEQKEAILPEDL